MQFIYGSGIDVFLKRADELAVNYGKGFALDEKSCAMLSRFKPAY